MQAATAWVTRLASTFQDVSAVDDADLTRQVKTNSMDALVDLAGHAVGSRFTAFARGSSSHNDMLTECADFTLRIGGCVRKAVKLARQTEAERATGGNVRKD